MWLLEATPIKWKLTRRKYGKLHLFHDSFIELSSINVLLFSAVDFLPMGLKEIAARSIMHYKSWLETLVNSSVMSNIDFGTKSWNSISIPLGINTSPTKIEKKESIIRLIQNLFLKLGWNIRLMSSFVMFILHPYRNVMDTDMVMDKLFPSHFDKPLHLSR